MGFVAATLRAETEIAADPQKGLDAAVVAVPTIDADRDVALAVLKATIELWRAGASSPSGAINDAAWTSGYDTMRALGFIDGSVPLDEMIDHLVKESVS